MAEGDQSFVRSPVASKSLAKGLRPINVFLAIVLLMGAYIIVGNISATASCSTSVDRTSILLDVSPSTHTTRSIRSLCGPPPFEREETCTASCESDDHSLLCARRKCDDAVFTIRYNMLERAARHQGPEVAGNGGLSGELEVEECKAACDKTHGCNSFTYGGKDGAKNCHLKVRCFPTNRERPIGVSPDGTQGAYYRTYYKKACETHVNPDRELSMQVFEVGLEIFGSKKEVCKVIYKASEPLSYNWHGVNFELLASNDDDTLFRLSPEYGSERFRSGGGFVYDIGANVGDITIFLAKLNPKLLIVAMEMVPDNYFYMLWNLHLNRINFETNVERFFLNSASGRGSVLAMHRAVTASNAQYSTMSAVQTSQDAIRKDTLDTGATDLILVKNVNLQQFLVYHHQAASAPVATGKMDLERYATSSSSVIRLLKIDCEGCEWDVIESIAPILTGKSPVTIAGLEAEMHLAERFGGLDLREKVWSILAARNCARSDKISC